MPSIDRLKLLAGLPIAMSDFTCFIYPATLKEIAVLGITDYFKKVNLLTLKKEEIKRIVSEEVEPFSFLLINAMYKEQFKDEIIKALEFFTREKVILIPEMEAFIIGDFNDSKILSADNFDEFQKILSAQNYIQEDVVKYTGEDEIAKRIREKLEKANKILSKIKKDSVEETIELTDLIASLAINSTINILEVWNISYYTFNDQFKRMRLLEQYNTSLQSIMAGADPKKVKLKDWIQSIQ